MIAFPKDVKILYDVRHVQVMNRASFEVHADDDLRFP
jgi:hypothetical protein